MQGVLRRIYYMNNFCTFCSIFLAYTLCMVYAYSADIPSGFIMLYYLSTCAMYSIFGFIAWYRGETQCRVSHPFKDGVEAPVTCIFGYSVFMSLLLDYLTFTMLDTPVEGSFMWLFTTITAGLWLMQPLKRWLS